MKKENNQSDELSVVENYILSTIDVNMINIQVILPVPNMTKKEKKLVPSSTIKWGNIDFTG